MLSFTLNHNWSLSIYYHSYKTIHVMYKYIMYLFYNKFYVCSTLRPRYVRNNSTKFKIDTIKWHETLNLEIYKVNSTYLFCIVMTIELNVPLKILHNINS